MMSESNAEFQSLVGQAGGCQSLAQRTVALTVSVVLPLQLRGVHFWSGTWRRYAVNIGVR